MTGTRIGGLKARQINKLKHGENFYKQIGSIGGHCSTTGGFASKKVGNDGLTGFQRARIYGKIGGAISRNRNGKHERDEFGRVLNKDGSVAAYSDRIIG